MSMVAVRLCVYGGCIMTLASVKLPDERKFIWHLQILEKVQIPMFFSLLVQNL